MAMEKNYWFRFTAYNEQAQYGYGTTRCADKYCDNINEGREINHWHYTALDADETIDLDGRDDTFDLFEAVYC